MFTLRWRFAWHQKRLKLLVSFGLVAVLLLVVGPVAVLQSFEDLMRAIGSVFTSSEPGQQEAVASDQGQGHWVVLLKEIGIPSSTIAVLIAFWGLWNDPRVIQLRGLVGKGKDQQTTQVLPAVRRHIEALAKARLGGKLERERRLIVFVDDLDRCDEKNIVRTLDAIRLVMDMPNVIVIVAIDAEIALDAVCDDEFYGDRGREYLEKIFQLVVHLPPTGDQQLERFVREGLFEFTDEDDVAIEADDVAQAPSTTSAEPLQQAGDSVSISQGDDDSLLTSGDDEVVGQKGEPAQEDEGKPVETDENDALVEEGSGAGLIGPEAGSLEQKPVQSGEAIETETEAELTERIAEHMEDRPEDIDRFLALAKAYAFTNPRLLLRLRNSNRLLRGLHSRRIESGLLPVFEAEDDAWIGQMLFWVEYLHQQDEDRATLDESALLDPDKMKSIKAPADAANKRDWITQQQAWLKQRRGFWLAEDGDEQTLSAQREAYDRAKRFVERTVLPRNAPPKPDSDSSSHQDQNAKKKAG